MISINLSADHSTVAGGHASGHVFTWEIARPAKPFLHIPPTDLSRLGSSASDGHVSGAAILHIGFLGTRNTALVSADDRGMAFSHLATRGMGVVSRSVRTTRILGRYPDLTPNASRPRKPSSVIAFSPLPLGNIEHTTDSMGLVAMLTPYLLVIVSTTPVAQTQHKATRPRELAEHGAMSAALAWFPCVKLKDIDTSSNVQSSNIKLAFCWSNVLMLLEIVEVESSDGGDKSPELQFKPRKRWKADEAIVAIQWLSRSVLGVMTITQQLIILEDTSFRVTDSSDLIKRHIYHVDLFSQQLSLLIEKLDEEDTSMHGVVADAFYMSFKSYKGRLFLLGFNDVSFGTLSNWADRLLALMEQGNFIAAIQLATTYYNGEADTATVGLPETPAARHEVVREKLVEMMSASLRYAFGKNPEAGALRLPEHQFVELAGACFAACISIADMDFLFEDVYAWYAEGEVQGVILEVLEPSIKEGNIKALPPLVLKDLIHHFVQKGWDNRLEEVLCRLAPETMDIDQITTLCKENKLYDALFYVWNQALGDYTTILSDLIQLAGQQRDNDNDDMSDPASKIFPYLSYILTGRVYATGEMMSDHVALRARAEIYHFLFSGDSLSGSQMASTKGPSFPNLENILEIDAPSFLGVLNEAFEDNFLNDSLDSSYNGDVSTAMTAKQRFGLPLTRQLIVSILLEVLVIPKYSAEDIVYLDMFVARNLPKYPQYILFPGSVLYGVLVDLCKYSTDDLGDDCQLSAEYLLSVYQPPDLPSMIPLFAEARFYRVMKSIYKAEKQYSLLLQTCFQDREDPDGIFTCIVDCLKPRTGLTGRQVDSVRNVIVEHAEELVQTDITKAASIIQEYANDLHRTIVSAIDNDENTQYHYLKAFMEPETYLFEGSNQHPQPPDSYFVELYVKLLCDYDPHHVSEYIEKLKVGDIRLEEVLPALEHSGAIDAAVILLAREGKVRDAIDRLIKHLQTIEAALLGLLDGVESTPDPENAQESADDLAESFDKYVRVGVWLCQGQSKSTSISRTSKGPDDRKSLVGKDLSPDELLWVDLLDVVVQATRNVSEMLGGQPSDSEAREDTNIARASSSTVTPIDHLKLLTSLRGTVQTTFSALLASTSTPPPAYESRSKNVTFLRVLRAFLNRASLSSPSLSNLRSVLAAIFSAYSYEESLLDLANRLLDKDLFIHVLEVTTLRKRGWRPLGQVCKGCGKRVWGPGAGMEVWNAWATKEKKGGHFGDDGNDNHHQSSSVKRRGSKEAGEEAIHSGSGKGKKAVVKKSEGEEKNTGTGSDVIDHRDNDDHNDEDEEEGRSSGALVIFSCRHIFHRTCLAKMMMMRSEKEKEKEEHENEHENESERKGSRTPKGKEEGGRGEEEEAPTSMMACCPLCVH